ncbi:DNA binding protein [Halomonas sp. McH1-25]|uniref:histone-like nucleoid-structuring protein, MvaT/MvaU family n=1 Tax=unclassified Halomonas TaxID=2609666 RepID=UPI001EF4911A|nr:MULTISPECIES: histone-like nucleoid-structuring protein, MvaT/MvaU family [unclassified Halomonas]MCG7598274.1 DNA binding protein [Halomonas sp. McH1-25]MCP1340943.1 DNA binding protein [Halomonas sp. FL8]MCP1362514.1 DNA binding protein [Halomonas sp. BBD45]MCP1367606.1 DNA binding protein [Halomonas sp. BBD48]
MSLLSEYLLKEQRLNQLSDELKQLESDQQLQADLAFKAQLESLMAEFDKRTSDVVNLLEALPVLQKSAPSQASAPSDGRRKRKLKVYENPSTGERIETRGGNHKTLKAWKDEHGAETVESWLVHSEG